jgi:hypothetical protein
MKLDRVISLATLVAAMVAIVLVLKRPAPVVQSQPAAPAAVHANSSDASTAQAEATVERAPVGGTNESAKTAVPSTTAPATQPTPQAVTASPKADSHADEISSMVAKMLGGTGGGALTPDSNVGSGEPNIKDQQVTTDGDLVHGRFLTEIGGKDVWVTISGHMGEKDGYATFDPTEFKVGDTEVPVALVNPLLQKKLAEERDRMRIPSSSQ